MIQLKPSTAKSFIKSCLNANLPVFNHGKPGIGKSDLYKQIAEEEGMALIDVRAILLDPVDLRGLPTVQKMEDGSRQAIWAVPGFLPNEERDGEEGILLLDELNAAPALVQAACFQLVLDRQLGEYHLPDGWKIVAAGNNDTDKAVTHRMPTPLKTRFVHLNMIPDLDDLAAWWMRNEKRPEVLAFLRFRSNLMFDFTPDSQTFPCPRTWSFVSSLLDSQPDVETEHALYSGAVGDGAAGEFVAFMRVYRSLPDIDNVIANPKKAPVPRASEPAVMYAIATALAHRAEASNLGNIVQYVERLPAEFGVLCLRDAASKYKGDGSKLEKFMKVREYRDWCVRNHELLI